MNKETLDHLELCIFAEQTHDINFQNIAKELFREVYLQKSEVDRLNNIINELEKDTIELMKSYKDVNASRYDMCKHFIYKIQELKGE